MCKKHLYTCKCLCINLNITSSPTLSVLIVDWIEKMKRQQEKLFVNVQPQSQITVGVKYMTK